jgi:hypothetical protein
MSPVPHALRRLPVVLATLAALGCGEGGTPLPTTPPPKPPVPGPLNPDAAPDSAFGAETAAIAALVAAQRAELSAAAHAALAGEPVDAASAALTITPTAPLAARWAASIASAPLDPARAVAATREALPLPIRFRDSRTGVHGQGDNSHTVTTSQTLDAAVEGTTLTAVSTERTEVRHLLATDPTKPRPSSVTDVRREFTLDVCPSAEGVVTGRYKSHHRRWFANGHVLAGPDANNRFEEVTLEGPVRVHVNDLAHIRAYDMDVLIGMRKTRAPGNRPMDRSATGRLRRTDVAPNRLSDHLNDAIVVDKTEDYHLLDAVGLGPVEDYVAFYQRVAATAGRARGSGAAATAWRSSPPAAPPAGRSPPARRCRSAPRRAAASTAPRSCRRPSPPCRPPAPSPRRRPTSPTRRRSSSRCPRAAGRR